MLGFVLGKAGDIEDFIASLYRTKDQLTKEEIDLLSELVQLAQMPGTSINVASKLGWSSAALQRQLAGLKRLGLIDYWEETPSAVPRPSLAITGEN